MVVTPVDDDEGRDHVSGPRPNPAKTTNREDHQPDSDEVAGGNDGPAFVRQGADG
jgi:hypothetical protein